jgi:hypothetical protein
MKFRYEFCYFKFPAEKHCKSHLLRVHPDKWFPSNILRHRCKKILWKKYSAKKEPSQTHWHQTRENPMWNVFLDFQPKVQSQRSHQKGARRTLEEIVRSVVLSTKSCSSQKVFHTRQNIIAASNFSSVKSCQRPKT